MKALNKIWIAAIAAVAMTACNNELSEQALNNGGNVNFTMGIGNTPSSRVSMPEDSYRASFTANDEVGIFVADVPSYTNVKYSTTDGTTWTGGPVNVSADAAYTYYAYYPYSESMVVNDIPVVVATNQDTDGYIKNDYLYSKLAATAGQKDVNLTFSHALSLVEVTLAGSGAAEGATVDLLNVAIDATIDLTSDTPVTTGTTTATVTMDALSNLKFRAIVPAQDIAASTPVFKIASGGRTYQAKYSDVMNFEQGKYLAMTITLGEQSGDAEIEITATADIADWGQGTSNGGDASISVTGFDIPLPTDGKVLETINLNWSSSTPSQQIGADKAEGWYKRSGFTTGSNPVAITSPVEIGYSVDDQALTIKKFSDSNGGWNNNPVVFHSCTPLERGVYELSFEFKDDGGDATLGALGVGLSSSNDNKLFRMLQKLKTEDTQEEYLADWSRTLTIFTAAEGAAWTAKTVYFSLEKASTSGSSGSSAPSYSVTTDDDVNKGVNIIFYSNKSGVETTLYIRNIKLSKSNFTYTEE